MNKAASSGGSNAWERQGVRAKWCALNRSVPNTPKCSDEYPETQSAPQMSVPLSVTIPLRFILTMGHFIVTLLVFWHKVRGYAAASPHCPAVLNRLCPWS